MNPIEMGKIFYLFFLVFILKFILALKALKKKSCEVFSSVEKERYSCFCHFARVRGAETRAHRRLLILLSDLAVHHKQQFVLKIISNSIM